MNSVLHYLNDLLIDLDNIQEIQEANGKKE